MRKDVSNHIMGSRRNADNRLSENCQEGAENQDENTTKASVRKPSLGTLITWNVSKALESDPQIDLRAALKEAQELLEKSHDVEALISSDARHLCCACLAWQQLGHAAADSLFDFAEKTLKEHRRKRNAEALRQSVTRSYASDVTDFSEIPSRNFSAQKNSSGEPSCQWGGGGSPKMDFSRSIGLVVKLPVEPQAVLHLSGPARVPNKLRKSSSRGKSPVSGTASKISSACCLDKECMERLESVDTETQQLRKRAALFAQREAERTELLERAEMAWRDLDAGYQRRLLLAKGKEEDIEKQIARLLEERNRYKELCTPLVTALKQKSEIAEKERETLTQLEQEVCAKACARVELLKNDARIDAALADQQCKVAQLDRDLALKEEQEIRKQRSLAGAVEAAQVLTHDAEYAQRTELAALKAQVQQVSQELLEEDERTALLKQRIADYMQAKDEMIEDLEGCQTMCDGRMEWLTNDLKQKREQIIELEKKVMECLCKEPVDKLVEVKRTPSLAAMCRCSPSDSVEATCSCTSLRSRLLSALLKDLFGGLKFEMEDFSTHMPCHLLKCLEDKHNWDGPTDVKKNVRAYFSKMLMGELDVAIATVIEKCHAQWVGECCADLRKVAVQGSENSMQEQELEMKTHQMASELAEKMFQEKAQELAKHAEEILSKDGRLPCECGIHVDEDVSGQNASAVYRCMVQSHPGGNLNKVKVDLSNAPVKDYRRDNTIIQQTQIGQVKRDANGIVTSTLNHVHSCDRGRKKDVKNIRQEILSKNTCGANKLVANQRNLTVAARRPIKSVTNKINSNKVRINPSSKVFKGPHQYAVNMCLCDGKNNINWKTESKTSCNHKCVSHVPSVRQSKPATATSFSLETNSIKDNEANKLPPTEKYACFHKSPSNTSVDRLIGVLSKWKDNLAESQESNIRSALNTDSLFKITHTSVFNVLQQLCGKIDSNKSIDELEHPMNSNKNIQPSKNRKKPVEKVDDCPKTIISSQIQINQSQCMGVINLDESNSPLCKPIHKTEGKEQNIHNPSQRIHSVKSVSAQITIKSKTNINNIIDIDTSSNENNNAVLGYVEQLALGNDLESSKAFCKDSEPYIQFLGVTLTNKTLEKSPNKIAGSNNKKPQEKSQRKISHHKLDSGLNSKDHKDKSINNNNNQHENIIAIIPKSDENHIQFLGVALDSVYATMVPKKEKQGHKIRNQFHKSDKNRYKINYSKDVGEKKYAEKPIKALNVLHLQNERTYKDLYSGVNKVRVNKAVEVSATKICDVPKKTRDEPCICCPTLDVDITNDLEVNTFQLLEDHLKRQLEQFKFSVCKSSCMQNADETNLVNDTLLKVKRLIMESASAVTCKCTENTEASGGSWKRAYNLLQEYLKAKIERIRCLCGTPGQSQVNNLVPHVLSKINCLIENDLQRLKNLCKCRNTTLSNNPDCVNTIEKIYTKNEIVESFLGNFTNLASTPYNKSAQVSIYHSVVTRSCDALKTYSKYSETQTVDIVKEGTRINDDDYCSFPNDQKNRSYKENTSCRSQADTGVIEPPKSSLPIAENNITLIPMALSSINIDADYKTRDSGLPVNEQKQYDCENIAEKALEPFLPYVGCTIDCCCDSDLGCICTKSAVPTNTDWWKNNNIWNTFSKQRNETDKYSYILSQLSGKLPDDAYSANKIFFCESAVSANEEMNINFKNMKQSKHTVNETTNTVNDANSVQFISLSCQSQRPGILKRKSEFSKHSLMYFDSNDTVLTTDEAPPTTGSLSTDCDCAMVPVCHVKMLMENIGSKLVNAECTCDSLKSVCPVHFQKSVNKNNK